MVYRVLSVGLNVISASVTSKCYVRMFAHRRKHWTLWVCISVRTRC